MIIKDSDRETCPDRWFEIRRGGLTATEAGAIAAGRRTIGGVWADKKSGKNVPSNPVYGVGEHYGASHSGLAPYGAG